jgi:NADP-dependent 3-hydroxy acid dehydrogenase YdfG
MARYDLAEKVALVTGGARGIGFATGRALVAAARPQWSPTSMLKQRRRRPLRSDRGGDGSLLLLFGSR